MTEIIVAAGTWALVIVTVLLVRGQLSVAKEQRKIQLYLELRKEFDGPLISARKLLARQLFDGVPHDKINEPVMNFFEDTGMLVRRGYIDGDIIWETFSYYVKMWWGACKDYIAREREDKDDDTIFDDFEDLVERIYEDEI
jgi:Domain of unknown function (DUF4760)